MEFKDIGIVISGIALLATFIDRVVRFSNADKVEQIFMNTKDRNAAAFYKLIITLFSFVFILSYFFYQLTSEKNFFMILFSGICSIIITIIWLSSALKDYVYFLHKPDVPYRIISKIDNDHLLIAFRENNSINKKIVPIKIISNKSLYVSKKTLLDKDYTIRQINKKLKIN